MDNDLREVLLEEEYLGLNFDGLECFKLEHRFKIARELYGFLKTAIGDDLVSIKSQFADETLYDALTYELFRLCIVRSDSDSSKKNRRSPQYQRSFNSVSKLFSDQNLDFMITAADHFGFSNQFMDDLISFKNVLADKEFRIRREVHAKNISYRTNHIGAIPAWVNPAKVRDSLFYYRWCLLLAYSHDLSRADAIKLFIKVKNHMMNRLNDFRSLKMISRIERTQLLLDCLPVSTSRYDKNITELSLPWAIEFMHSDYAGLLKWDVLGQQSNLPFIARFVSNALGGHILEARLVNRWTNRSDEWHKLLKKKGPSSRRLPDLHNESKKIDQAVEIDGTFCAFNYLPELDPRYPLNRGLKTYDPLELCDGVFSYKFKKSDFVVKYQKKNAYTGR